MATDPICGMTVDPKSAAGKHEHNGQTYYFCSQHCLAKFKEDPEKWLDTQHGKHIHGTASHAEHAQGETHAAQSSKTAKPDDRVGVYVCPMDPEVRESKPGACPKCGMALEPATLALADNTLEYVCPMHPEIVRPEPGSCPICGMALEPQNGDVWKTHRIPSWST